MTRRTRVTLRQQGEPRSGSGANPGCGVAEWVAAAGGDGGEIYLCLGLTPSSIAPAASSFLCPVACRGLGGLCLLLQGRGRHLQLATRARVCDCEIPRINGNLSLDYGSG